MYNYFAFFHRPYNRIAFVCVSPVPPSEGLMFALFAFAVAEVALRQRDR